MMKIFLRIPIVIFKSSFFKHLLATEFCVGVHVYHCECCICEWKEKSISAREPAFYLDHLFSWQNEISPRNEIFRRALYSLNKHAGMQAHYGVKRMDFIPTPPPPPPSSPPASYFSAVCIFSCSRDTLHKSACLIYSSKVKKFVAKLCCCELNFWHFCATFVRRAAGRRRCRKKSRARDCWFFKRWQTFLGNNKRALAEGIFLSSSNTSLRLLG